MVQQQKDTDAVDSKSLVRRWITYIIGIYILTLGISLAIRAGIGISPQSSLTRTMTLVIPGISQGTFNLILEVLMLILTFAILPRAFKARNLLAMVPALILASLLDFNLMLTQWIVLDAYAAKLSLLVLGDLALAFGLFLMIRANLVLMPIDMFVNTIQMRTGHKWGNIKTAFDLTLLLVSVSIGLAFLGAPHFIREGTLINAILVGQCVKLFFLLDKKFFSEKRVLQLAGEGSSPSN